MLKIGEFSKLSRVSIRMLRHYDDIGLLKPAEIDTFTGYRYYHEEQLFVIGRITSLKDITIKAFQGNGVQTDASGNSQKEAEEGAKHEF